MVLDNCSDACGFIAAIIALFCLGSFGVPIKSDRANKVNIDPLAMQTYKSTMCLLLCWIVLLFGVKFSFTPWGIVSGIFWVPGGTAVVFSIRNAGLAISMGLCSSLIVMVSFTWGIFIFEEKVRSLHLACLAVLLMVLGLWGMAYYSQPHCQVEELDSTVVDVDRNITEDSERVAIISSQNFDPTTYASIRKANKDAITEEDILSNCRDETLLKRKSKWTEIELCGRYWTRRQLGIAGACFQGVWGGSMVVPMHYAGSRNDGLGYAISFGIGQFIVLILIWLLRYLYNVYQYQGDANKGFQALPSLYIMEMWLPGTLCGALWEIANIGSLVSVQFLGEGVGFSVVQAALLVSGLWGIFWFHEIRGRRTILLWLTSALITLAGVILLSHEHLHGSG